MKTGTTNTYVSAQLASLLTKHGPRRCNGREFSRKVRYIVCGWDMVMREESDKWLAAITESELHWLRDNHAALIDRIEGSTADVDPNGYLLELNGALCKAIGENDDPCAKQLVKRLRKASIASTISLSWIISSFL